MEAKDIEKKGQRFLEAARRQCDRSLNNEHKVTSKDLDELTIMAYKAGQEDVCTVSVSEVYDKGRKAGRKEVVEWIKENAIGDYRIVGWVRIEPEDWEAQLKEWDVEDKKKVNDGS